MIFRGAGTKVYSALARVLHGNAIACLALALLTLALLAPLSVMAAEHGGGHGGGSILDLVPYWINFLIFVVGLWYLLRKGAVAFWEGRKQSIAESVSIAGDELRRARDKLAEVRQRFEGVEQEAEKVRVMIERETESEQQEVVSESNKRAEIALERARQTVASERSAGEKQLRRELAERVIEKARNELKEILTADEDHQRRRDVLDAFKQILH